MERGNFTYLILIVLLLLLLGGVISLGDIVSVIFYVILGIVLLIAIGGAILRAKIRRAQREAEEQGRQWTGYHPFENRNSKPRNEGEVKLNRNGAGRSKKVGKDVGEYVDFEDVKSDRDSHSTENDKNGNGP